jgi:hypothetical protein
MAEPLSVDALVEQAHKNTGVDAFDCDSYREGLEVFVRDFNNGIKKGLYVDTGIERVRGDCVHYLSNRLRVWDYLQQNPELLDRPIEKPVFVMGVPRTGTTLLSNLLAADPARRSPLEWEIDEPVPPATTATLKTDPRCLARLEREKAMLAAHPEMGRIYRSSAVYPHECVWFLAHDFKTLMIESKGVLPEYREFIFNADMTSAYAWHRKFLQALQHKAPGVWNLKMPSHILHLDYLIKEYPDARLVWTHRDPITATGSLCSIISMSHQMVMGRIDTEWLGEDYPWQAQQHAERGMDFRDKHGEDRVIDVHYADMVDDPKGTMKRLYAQLGDEWTSAAEAGIQGWLDENPQNKFGKHEYKLAKYGLSQDKLEPMFERYLSRYDVAREG